MKAIIHSKYGPPDELQLQEVEKPYPKDNEILIKIHATTVTSTDCNLRNFTFLPKLLRLPVRLEFGLRTPKHKILGVELAGEIEAIGKEVQRFKIGDKVYGSSEPTFGAHAQYICMPEDGVLTKIPTNINYEEAATVSLAGHTAIFFLRDQAKIKAGQKVLIIGASGAIGTFAVQLAKYYGTEVTGVCSTTNLELVKSLGADSVIDYTKEDFTKSEETYDVVFDAVHKSSFMRCNRLLNEEGIYLVTMPSLPFLLQLLWTSIVGKKTIKNGSGTATVDDLLFFNKLFESGRMKAIIDRRYPLKEIVAAFRYVEQGHKKGNVVITVEHN